MVHDFDRPASCRRVEALADGADRALGTGRPEARAGGARGARPELRHRPVRPVRQAAPQAPRPAHVRRGSRGPRSQGRGRRARPPRGAARDPYGSGFEGLVPNLRRATSTGAGSIRRTSSRTDRCVRAAPARATRLAAAERAVKVKGRTIAEYVNLPGLGSPDRGRVARALAARGDDREPVAPRDPGPLRFLNGRRRRLPHAQPERRHALRRGRAAHPPGHARSGRTSRACSTSWTSRRSGSISGTTAPARHARPAPRSRQHRGGRRARRGDHRTGDYVIDLGPGAGEHGGYVIFPGAAGQLLEDATDP